MGQGYASCTEFDGPANCYRSRREERSAEAGLFVSLSGEDAAAKRGGAALLMGCEEEEEGLSEEEDEDMSV
jgi:hypothetical protein